MAEPVDGLADFLAAVIGAVDPGVPLDYHKFARAVLKHLLEPTEGMFMAGGGVPISNRGGDHQTVRRGKRIGDYAARDAWRAMIRSALDVDVKFPRPRQSDV